MAPLIERENTDDSNALREHKTTRTVWVVVSVAVVSLAFLTVVAIVGIKWYKGRVCNDAVNKNPYIAKKEISRRRNMSDLDRFEEEELQRQFMIRKSLASRTSSWTDSRLYETVSEEQHDMAEEDRFGNLRSDWKEWEAKLQRERSRSCESHPAVDPSTKSRANLAVPAPARADSPSRRMNRSPTPRPAPSPALPRIPSKESLASRTPSPRSPSPLSAGAKEANPWAKSKIHAISYDRLETSER